MQLRTELQAFSTKINLPLLDSTVAFVLDTAEATRAQRAELRRQCPFLSASAGNAFQEKYGFLYLGELLERYEERFGMSTQDLRAIALALAYTRDLTTGEMFVGPQRNNFLRRVRKAADGDIYLSGALYLLDEGKDEASAQELKLTGTDFDSTEDLLFVLGLFRNQEQAFLHFKPQLLRLLGRERTMPVIGNILALNWLVAWLAPQLKAARGKDLALFRALCALPVSFVKTDSKPHGVLLEHGCSPLEIAYANMMAVLAHPVEGTLRTDSIVSEKIAVALFHEALSGDTPLAPETYEQLSAVYRLYERFSIKCYGCERLLQALEPDTRIRNADTFLWFSTLTDIYSPVFSGFDIMDGKWDALAGSLSSKQYRILFEACLDDGMTQEEIQRRLDRYQELTGSSYVSFYWEHSYGTRFGLLVNKGILDLWSLFRDCLNEDGQIAKPEMISHIWSYVRSIRTPQAYRFFEPFFTVYGAEGLERFFGYRCREFFEALIKRQNYSSDPLTLDMHRDYLDDNGHRQLLQWLETYVFIYLPEKYLALIAAILRDDAVAGLFSPKEQRKLFDLIARQPDTSQSILNELRRRYLTEPEQQAEREAEAAARRASELRQQEETVQGIRKEYGELLDGTFASVVKFLDGYKYYRDKRPIACRIVREDLDRLLESWDHELDSQEAVRFLYVCGKLVREGSMTFAEARSCINQIKERAEHDDLPE